MTLRSSTILVSERDTLILYYPGVETWHSDPLLSWCRNVTPDPLLSWCQNVTLRSSTILVSERDSRSSTILVSERDTPILYYPGVGTWHYDPLLSWCRNVTLDPLLSWCRNVTLRSPNTCRNVTLRSNITVSERDTPIHLCHYFYSVKPSLCQGFILIERI